MRQFGFSVMEMVVAMAVLAIFSTMALPAFHTFLQNNRSLTTANQFVSALQLAKSEAVKLNSAVSICTAADSNQNSCANSADWSNGWIIFTDPNQDGAMANTSDRIKVSGELPVKTSITSSLGVITFDGQGFLFSNTGNISISATGCSSNNAKLIALSSTGRANITKVACS